MENIGIERSIEWLNSGGNSDRSADNTNDNHEALAEVTRDVLMICLDCEGYGNVGGGEWRAILSLLASQLLTYLSQKDADRCNNVKCQVEEAAIFILAKERADDNSVLASRAAGEKRREDDEDDPDSDDVVVAADAEVIVKALVKRGFDENGARRSAMAVKNQSLGKALEWAMAHSNDEDFDSPAFVNNENGGGGTFADGRASPFGGAFAEVRCALVTVNRLWINSILKIIGAEMQETQVEDDFIQNDGDREEAESDFDSKANMEDDAVSISVLEEAEEKDLLLAADVILQAAAVRQKEKETAAAQKESSIHWGNG